MSNKPDERSTVRVPRSISLELERAAITTHVPASLLDACSWTGCARTASNLLRVLSLVAEAKVSIRR